MTYHSLLPAILSMNNNPHSHTISSSIQTIDTCIIISLNHFHAYCVCNSVYSNSITQDQYPRY